MNDDDSSSDDDFFQRLVEDDDDDNNDDDIALLLLLDATSSERQATGNVGGRRPQRASFYVREQLEWDAHVAELAEEGPQAFSQLYRVQPQTFATLCSLIHPFLQKDSIKAINRSGCATKGPITTEIALHCLLRWLGGGSYLDIRLSAGIGRSSFFIRHQLPDTM
jgi:hypothetical protein